MDCPTCGYVMDAFVTECPRCKRLGEHAKPISSHVIATPQADTPHSTIASGGLTEEARTRRDDIINYIELWRMLTIKLSICIGCLTMGGSIVDIYLVHSPYRQFVEEPIAINGIFAGIMIIISGLASAMILRWMAEILRVLGRLEEKNPSRQEPGEKF